MHAAAARIALIGAIFLIASAASAASPRSAAPGPQNLSKLRGETDEAFAVRVLRLGDSDAHLLATTWNGARMLFVDYVRGADTEAPERPLVALEEAVPGTFRMLQVTVGETEGGEPDIAAIGFANADRDPAKELIVILAWRQYHATACGPIYEVRIFDDPDDPARKSLRQLPISKHFGEGCADKPGRFRFTTIGVVKAELSRLGY
jgi:hypothetical protein